MTAVAAQEDIFRRVGAGVDEGAEVAGHMAGGGDKKEGGVGEEVVFVRKGCVFGGLKVEFAVSRVLQDARQKRRFLFSWPPRCRRLARSRPSNDVGVGELGAISYMIEMQMAEDDGVDITRSKPTSCKNVHRILSDVRLEQRIILPYYLRVILQVLPDTEVEEDFLAGRVLDEEAVIWRELSGFRHICVAVFEEPAVRKVQCSSREG